MRFVQLIPLFPDSFVFARFLVLSFFYFFAGNGFRNHFEDDRASVDRRTFEKPDESFETIFELFLNEVS